MNLSSQSLALVLTT